MVEAPGFARAVGRSAGVAGRKPARRSTRALAPGLLYWNHRMNQFLGRLAELALIGNAAKERASQALNAVLARTAETGRADPTR